MRKSVIKLAVVATVGLGTSFGAIPAKTEAESISKLKEEQNKIHEQRSDLNSNINQANDKITNLQGQQTSVKSELKRLDLAISDATTKIDEKQAKIEDTKAQIAELQEETKVLKDRIKKRNVLLKDRARSYQDTGGMVNYLDVLMGSTSFSDFIDRANAVATIMQADQDILKQHEADKNELEEKQSQVEKDLASLKKMLADLETMNKQLTAQKAEKDKLLGSLESQEHEAHEGMLDLKEQEEILAAQEISIQKTIKQEQERQAREAAAAAAAAAAKKKAAASSNSGSSSNSSSNSSSSSAAAPQVSSGSFTRPAPGVVTSGYGGRWGSFHWGVDIAQSGNNVPIVAAADGVVSVAHYSSSYGNVVYISHSINGQVYTTVYAHMSGYQVSPGQTVSKGQRIGTMGNTGDSHGQHLHFELYKGPWAYHSAINPIGIVPI
ncbi:murein hydrolase activator EnvC family protein [Neobacillus vireti]|uniref:Peptidase M23 n=1 Tax=Neobacillus vireti LMG 21834 TaxID=1131730 RepID=A0AB94IJW8_9BACI|nr:peptidoglycan DD-metalloendopeptidase family protein [Neobacillus vireti]ETI67314.1 peptidase M23 [Neobacillus vireti LMG 21834]KLT18287.1 peptidase M23 [Neobacillus vireti]